MLEIVHLMLSADCDRDGMIDKWEAEKLALRVSVALRARNIELNEDKFKVMVRNNTDMRQVFKGV